MPWLRLVLLAACCAGAPARAQVVPTPGKKLVLRVDRMRHGAADRVVIWLRRGSGFAARQEGTSLVLSLPGNATLAATDLTAAQFPGQFVRGISAMPGAARLTLAASARPRVWPWSDRVVIDVDATSPTLRPGQYFPPVAAAPAAPAVTPTGAPAAMPAAAPAPKGGAQPSAVQLPVVQRPSAAGAASVTLSPLPGPMPAVPQGNMAPAQPLPPTPVIPPTATSALLLGADPASGGPSVFLPAARLTGAAAFLRSGELHVVLDAARLLDLSQLKDDPTFGGATERLLPDGMELRLRPGAGAQAKLARREDGWVLSLGTTAPPVPSVKAQAKDGVLSLEAAAAGHVVIVEDEASGGRLMVGTQRGAGQRVAGGHKAAEWVLLPSLQGVVVQPLSDRVLLLSKETGFQLKAADPPALALLWPDGTDPLSEGGRAMTRRFDLPGLPVPVLRRRLAEALRDAALAPRTARAAPRLRVAEAMLACGLDAEAAAVVQVASADDPAAASDPAAAGLAAIAAWLSAEAGGAIAVAPAADMAALGGSDEAALWRALWTPPGGDAPAAAAIIASRWGLLRYYPELLRRRMLPAVADVLARGGQENALAALLAAFPDPALDLARAGLLQRQGKVDDSLHLLDRLAAGVNRLVRAKALEAGVEQRLAARRLTPQAAADLLEHQFYAWRGGDRELRLRLRAAALRAESGEWRGALALLRETDGLFPEAHGRIHDAEISVVSGLLHTDRPARLEALDLFALAEDAASLLGDADADAALAPLLADRLLALDLPAQAEPIIRRLLDKAGDGAAKGALGLRLAGLVADRGDAAGALAVLDHTADQRTADAALMAGQTLLRARLLAASGRAPAAIALLSGVVGRPAMEMLAGLQESDHDWSGAVKTLETLLASADFAALPDATKRDQVLRAARDAGETHDMAGLRALRAAYDSLFRGSSNAGLFAVLTADPVQRLDDLPRAGRELVAMRSLSQDLSGNTARR